MRKEVIEFSAVGNEIVHVCIYRSTSIRTIME